MVAVRNGRFVAGESRPRQDAGYRSGSVLLQVFLPAWAGILPGMEKAVEAIFSLLAAAVCGSIPLAGIGALFWGRRGAVAGAIIGAIAGPIVASVFAYLVIRAIAPIA